MSEEIRFHCIGCGIELAATQEHIGIHIRCDHCDTKQEVYDESQSAIQASSTPKKKSKLSAKKFSAPQREYSNKRKTRKKKSKVPTIFILLIVIIAGSGFFLYKPSATVNQSNVSSSDKSLPSTSILQESQEISTLPLSHTMNAPIESFMGKYCFDCHNDDKQKGGVQLDTLTKHINNNSIAQKWQDVLDVLNTGDMPPRKAKQPTKNELSEFISSLTKDLVTARKVLTHQGGEIVIRRLNKLEYINSIKALTGFNLPSKLVPDDAGSGEYNTMGGSQNFPPSLIEKYLELGELAIRNTLLAGSRPHHKPVTLTQHLSVKQIREAKQKQVKDFTDLYNKALLVIDKKEDFKKHGFKDELAALHTKNNHNAIVTLMQHYLDHETSKTGILLMPWAHTQEVINMPVDFRAQYKVRLTVATEKGMPEKRKYLKVLQNEHLVGYYHVHGTIDNPQKIEIDITPKMDVAHLQILISEKTNQRIVGALNQIKYTQKVNKGGFIPTIWVNKFELEGPFYDGNAKRVYQDIVGDINLENASTRELQNLFRSFAKKAFRGASVDESYITTILNIYQQEIVFAKTRSEALIKPLATILSSPDFLYIGEQKPKIKKTNKLNPRELATRLSYTLFKEPPSEELISKATQFISDKPLFEQHLEDMFDDPKLSTFIEQFFGQWLHLKKFDHLTFSKTKFPDFDGGHTLSSKQQIFEFIGTVIKEDLSLKNFIDSDFTVVNSILATHYGLPKQIGDDFKKVRLSVNFKNRGGLLGMAAIQAMGSTGDRTSPVERGAFILCKFLNSPPPPPPPNVPQLDINAKGLTNRELLDKHNEIAQCHSCHSKMDPLGLAMEGFNTVGEWTQLTGRAQAQMAGKMPDGTSFKNFTEMKSHLLNQCDKMIESIIEGLIMYGLGREREFTDDTFVENLLLVAQQNNYRFKPLLKAFLTSKQFRHK